MSAEPFIGEIMMWGGYFAPRGWAFCNGQLLPIIQFTALFAQIGTTYGGNGHTTFALPDLCGRVPLGAGSGEGLTPRLQGQMSGQIGYQAATITLNQTEEGDAAEIVAPPARGTIPTTPPYQPVSFVIALEGLWPPRD